MKVLEGVKWLILQDFTTCTCTWFAEFFGWMDDFCGLKMKPYGFLCPWSVGSCEHTVMSWAVYPVGAILGSSQEITKSKWLKGRQSFYNYGICLWVYVIFFQELSWSDKGYAVNNSNVLWLGACGRLCLTFWWLSGTDSLRAMKVMSCPVAL